MFFFFSILLSPCTAGPAELLWWPLDPDAPSQSDEHTTHCRFQWEVSWWLKDLSMCLLQAISAYLKDVNSNLSLYSAYPHRKPKPKEPSETECVRTTVKTVAKAGWAIRDETKRLVWLRSEVILRGLIGSLNWSYPCHNLKDVSQ